MFDHDSLSERKIGTIDGHELKSGPTGEAKQKQGREPANHRLRLSGNNNAKSPPTSQGATTIEVAS
jgi:hypothetical protein